MPFFEKISMVFYIGICKTMKVLKYTRFIGKDIQIAPNSKIGRNVFIGKSTNINGPCYITSNCNIGSCCAIGHNLRVRTANHTYRYPNMLGKLQSRYGFIPVTSQYTKPVDIGNACWIADNVIVLPNVSIGDGAVIGAGSVVTKDIPAFAVAVGCPARVIKYRFHRKVITQMLDIKWWDWDANKIKKNKQFFETDLTRNVDIDLYSIIK